MISSGNEITIKQGAGRLTIDIDTGDVFIHDDINNESVFIDPTVWGEGLNERTKRTATID